MEKMFRCCRCGHIKRIKHIYYNREYCNECYDEILYTQFVGRNPKKWNFFSVKEEKKLFLGLELETDNSVKTNIGEIAQKLHEFLTREKSTKYIAIKDDGSLKNGLEIITHPFTLNWAKNKSNFEKILLWLKQHHFHNRYYTAGLHIHVNKDFFKQEDLTKLRVFFALNKSYLFKLSGRKYDDNKYCLYEKYNLWRIKNTPSGHRHMAVHYETEGTKTVEIRIFNSSLNYERLLSCLEFADAISRYCKQKDLKTIGCRGNKQKSWSQFMYWVENNNQYQYLFNDLQRVYINV